MNVPLLRSATYNDEYIETGLLPKASARTRCGISETANWIANTSGDFRRFCEPSEGDDVILPEKLASAAHRFNACSPRRHFDSRSSTLRVMRSTNLSPPRRPCDQSVVAAVKTVPPRV